MSAQMSAMMSAIMRYSRSKGRLALVNPYGRNSAIRGTHEARGDSQVSAMMSAQKRAERQLEATRGNPRPSEAIRGN